MRMLLCAAAGVAVSIHGLSFGQMDAPKHRAPSPSTDRPPDLSKDQTLYVVGYAHLDTQWRWTYQDTIREFIPNTLHDNFRLFEKYPHYVFNFSGSRRYRMMEEYYPREFAKLKDEVAAGHWFPCGSSVDENDANVPSAESLIRHVLYGNKYFRGKFGKASEEYMLPDCFGFPAALPSVLAHCGIKGFSTQKLTWNAVVPIPFKVGVWEGPDGHGVIAALDPGAYVGEVRENLANSNGWEQRIKANGEKSGVYADYHYFGTGDQGGAPGAKSVEMVEKSVATDGKIRVISAPADAMFQAITPQQREHLPRYKGELMLTQHSAGSISSQAYMKRWNRKNELLADAAERASVAAMWMGGRAYPAEKLENAWYLVLGSQMHDILPGTSVPKAYDLSWNDECIAANQFESVLSDAAASVISRMTTTGVTGASCIVVYNPLSREREDVVEAWVSVPRGIAPAGVSVVGPDGQGVPAQILGDEEGGGRAHVAFVAKAPSVGFAAYAVQLSAEPPAQTSPLKVSERRLENETYVVTLDEHGDVASVFDKRLKKELLSAPARLGLYHENPSQWPAWNQDWTDRQLPARSFAGESGPVSFKVVERGPARVAVEVTREAEGSKFIQRISLAGGGAGDRVVFDSTVDWRSKQRSLRASFPLTVSNPTATYDIQVGAIERPNSHEKQYEYSFHKWFDLTDSKGDAGVTIACDSKYAADKPDDRTVRLTLLYTPGTRGGYPDQGTQDIGRHHFVYALYGHAGDWRDGTSWDVGDRVNQPLIAFSSTGHEGGLGRSLSLFGTSDAAVGISAIKKAEASDEVIVRLREQCGKAVKGVRVRAAGAIVGARELDGQERPLDAARVENGELAADIGPFELKAFAIRLGDPKQKPRAVASQAVDLALDADAASTNAKRDDGAMDAAGSSYPAEQLPGEMTLEGVTFRLGGTADGQNNAVACKGQEVPLPQGSFNRLFVLAAADGDVDATLSIGGRQSPWHVQNWGGYVGQWDRRVWPSEVTDATPGDGGIAGLDPGFVKPDAIAWYCSHHHTPKGDALYEYSYIFEYAFDLPAGAKSVTLPNDPRIKVFAMSVAQTGGERVLAAAPLFDTLGGHAPDAPGFSPAAGTFNDATTVSIVPGLYWREGAVHYTTDGSAPTPNSPVYHAGITLNSPTTLKAAVLSRDGAMGPVATAEIRVNDTTGPGIKHVLAMYETPMLKLDFSEALDASAADPSHYSISPPIEITGVKLSGSSVALALAGPPRTGTEYSLRISGVRDASPARNACKDDSATFSVRGPVFSLDEVRPEQRGKPIPVQGLPVKAGDSWTLNMFVKPGTQPDNRTIIAGFGTCAQGKVGGARYMAKFVNGIHFWSHNQDASTRTPLSLNEWQMLTATYDGSTIRVYKDGTKIGERTAVLADDESVVTIAPKDPWEGVRQFDGQIRGFTIWDAALSEDALKALRARASLP